MQYSVDVGRTTLRVEAINECHLITLLKDMHGIPLFKYWHLKQTQKVVPASHKRNSHDTPI